MTYEIKLYGNPVLREPARRMDSLDDDLKQLVADMLETMYASNGLGLAATQIGRGVSLCVMDVPGGDNEEERAIREQNPDVPMPLVMFNPDITAMEGENVGQEGCLSFPEIFITVPRAERVEVRFLDREGKEQSASVTGLLARAVQHEIDHLNGVLLVDKMTAVQKITNGSRLKRIKADGAAQATTPTPRS